MPLCNGGARSTHNNALRAGDNEGRLLRVRDGVVLDDDVLVVPVRCGQLVALSLSAASHPDARRKRVNHIVADRHVGHEARLAAVVLWRHLDPRA